MIALEGSDVGRILHSMGVNIRYLGPLAVLALAEENMDIAYFKERKQRLYRFPFYWLEFLVIEMIARAIKHFLASCYTSDPKISTAPSATIAAVFNHVFSLFNNTSETEDAHTVGSNGHAHTEGESTKPEKSSSKKKKGKKNGKNVPHNSGFTQTLDGVSKPIAVGAASTIECLARIQSIIAERFCFVLEISSAGKSEEKSDPNQAAYVKDGNSNKGDAGNTSDTGNTGSKDSKDTEEKDTKDTDRSKGTARASPSPSLTARASPSPSLTASFLRSRVAPVTLLRRICQVTGVRVISRDYHFTKGGLFCANDIMSLVPKVVTSEPEVFMVEVKNLLAESGKALAEKVGLHFLHPYTPIHVLHPYTPSLTIRTYTYPYPYPCREIFARPLNSPIRP